jgi:hypothetical protein
MALWTTEGSPQNFRQGDAKESEMPIVAPIKATAFTRSRLATENAIPSEKHQQQDSSLGHDFERVHVRNA